MEQYRVYHNNQFNGFAVTREVFKNMFNNSEDATNRFGASITQVTLDRNYTYIEYMDQQTKKGVLIEINGLVTKYKFDASNNRFMFGTPSYPSCIGGRRRAFTPFSYDYAKFSLERMVKVAHDWAFNNMPVFGYTDLVANMVVPECGALAELFGSHGTYHPLNIEWTSNEANLWVARLQRKAFLITGRIWKLSANSDLYDIELHLHGDKGAVIDYLDNVLMTEFVIKKEEVA